jgi:hypothetical protein
VALLRPVHLPLQGLEARVVVVGDPIVLDMANLLQSAVEAEAEVIGRLLRPASGATADRAEVGVVIDDDVAEADPGVLYL